MTLSLFDDLRPYQDHEIHAAMCRIADSPYLRAIISYLYPEIPLEQVQEAFRRIHTIDRFQQEMMHPAIRQIVKTTMSSFTCGGIERLHPGRTYLFVSNHRDIVLDSALLQIALVENGFRTTEITFGSNLMHPEFVVDVGKANKMFKVIRSGSPRDFYNNSRHLSAYIRHTLLEKRESVWIAQRNGRTKNGMDATDQGIIKMFAMSGSGDVIHSLAVLNIVPISISYQYETCDNLKARELYISQDRPYLKAPGEDLHSILSGIREFKGGVHLEITSPITPEELEQFRAFEKNELYCRIAKLVDDRINSHYYLWNTNYLAYDMLHHTRRYTDRYTPEEYEQFARRMRERLAFFTDEQEERLEKIYLGIYANSVR